MNIAERPIAEIEPYGKNAKKHTEQQVKQIAESIREFGFNQPIVVDKDGVIIVGHGRYMAALYLGMQEVPVLQVDIDEERAKAYRLADNKLNESDWDMQLVIAELKSLGSIEMVDLTGFDRKLVINDNDRDDDVPAMPKVARTQPGDIYQLGEHRVMCGDSTKESEFDRLLKGKNPDMVFTDPPYNVDYKGSGKNTSQGIMNDKMEDAAFLAFLTAAFGAMQAVKRGAAWYIFHSPTTQAVFEQALKANDLEVITQLIWNKPSAGLGMNAYRAKHEPFFYAGSKGFTPQFYGDRTNTTVIDFQKTDEQLLKWVKKQKKAEQEGRTTIWTMKRAPVQEYVHPTQKPVELVMYALHNSSKVGDVVLDPFLGSGSTLIGCEKTNRECYGMELDPLFVDVIVERWVQFTGQREIKLNGEPIVW